MKNDLVKEIVLFTGVPVLCYWIGLSVSLIVVRLLLCITQM